MPSDTWTDETEESVEIDINKIDPKLANSCERLGDANLVDAKEGVVEEKKKTSPPPPIQELEYYKSNERPCRGGCFTTKRVCVVLFLLILGVFVTIVSMYFTRWREEDSPKSGVPSSGEETKQDNIQGNSTVKSGVPTLSPAPSNSPVEIPSATSISPTHSPAPSPLPTSSAYGMITNMLSSYTPIESLQDPATPQGKAFEQLVSEQRQNGGVTSPPGRILQRYGLMTTFLATSGDPETSTGETQWKSAEGWKEFSPDECTWHGVTKCGQKTMESGLRIGGHRRDLDSAFQVVTELDLSNNGMTGTIPPEICLLSPSLELLDVSRNSLSGPLPSCLSTFNNLVKFGAKQNNLSGSLPSGLLSIPSLKSVIVGNNVFTGTLQDLFTTDGCSGNLTVLQIGINNLTGTIPGVMETCTSLVELDLFNNEINGSIADELSLLHDLEALRLGQNNFASGRIPDFIHDMIKLRILELDGNNFTGELSGDVGNLFNLRILRLNDNSLGGKIPSQLHMLDKVIKVHLENNAFVGEVDYRICDLFYAAKLEKLTVDCTVSCDCCQGRCS